MAVAKTKKKAAPAAKRTAVKKAASKAKAAPASKKPATPKATKAKVSAVKTAKAKAAASKAKAPVKKLDIAVVGATGLVGKAFLRLMEERDFPVGKLYLFASERSKNAKVTFRGQTHLVHDVAEVEDFSYDVAFFSAGTQVSLDYAHRFVDRGALVVDNSAAFRMAPHVPLVVPEVNMEAAFENSGVIANPNCSTIQMVVALWPLHKAFGIKRIVVTTFQSVSGTGTPAIEELRVQSEQVLKKGIEKSHRHGLEKNAYPHQIGFNCLPHIDKFEEDGYTKEEHKMINETRKIFGEPKMKVTATTVRVPVFRGHSESVNVEFETPVTPDEVTAVLRYAPGVTLVDDPSKNHYPMPLFCEWEDDVFVGRIRKDESVKHGVNMWVVADNILKGAALNGIQIVEEYFNLK